MKEEVKHGKKQKFISFDTLLDKFTFFHILILWCIILLGFGFIYYLFSGDHSFIRYSTTMRPVTGLLDNIYFSFITATSTGYGDLTPVGFFKVLAIVEVIFGLVLMAVVTSKLVSIKQDIIMTEIYDISFNERVNRIRSALLLFRQNLGRIITNIETNTIRNREVSDIFNYISSLEDTLHEIGKMVGKDHDNTFTKTLDPLNTELIFNSVTQSFEKLYELVSLMNNNGLEWKRAITLNLIKQCIATNDILFETLHKSSELSEKVYTDLYLHNKKALEPLRGCLDGTSSCELPAIVFDHELKKEQNDGPIGG
jgi:potassium channel LctB